MNPHLLSTPIGLGYVIFGAFQIWMLIDAVRRRAEFYWYLVIVFLPFGMFIYFWMVKLQGAKAARASLPSAVPLGPSLTDLAARVQETPSELNKLAYADALATEQRYAEAVERYRDVLTLSASSREALHGLGRSLLALGRAKDAGEELALLMEIDPAFRDYGAALDYAEALWQAGEHDDAIGLLTGLVGVSKRINHRMALAHYLKEQGDRGTARSELEEALREFASSPDYVKRRDQRWADRARRLLTELS